MGQDMDNTLCIWEERTSNAFCPDFSGTKAVPVLLFSLDSTATGDTVHRKWQHRTQPKTCSLQNNNQSKCALGPTANRHKLSDSKLKLTFARRAALASKVRPLSLHWSVRTVGSQIEFGKTFGSVLNESGSASTRDLVLCHSQQSFSERFTLSCFLRWCFSVLAHSRTTDSHLMLDGKCLISANVLSKFTCKTEKELLYLQTRFHCVTCETACFHPQLYLPANPAWSCATASPESIPWSSWGVWSWPMSSLGLLLLAVSCWADCTHIRWG